MKETIEGKIKLILHDESIEKPTKASAFYNPRMVLNRDLAIAAANAFFKDKKGVIRACEPLAATGVRALRYAKEVRNTQVICADTKRSAYAAIIKNIDLNNLKNVAVFHEDALQNLQRAEYDLIDLDPFGTPAPFLETAMKQIKIGQAKLRFATLPSGGGLLGITATDMTAMCGIEPEAAQRRYGGKTLRTEYCYEIGARVLIYAAAKLAEKYKKSVEPLMVLGVDHYIRIWLGAQKSGAQGLRKNYGYIYHCFECDNRKISKEESGFSCDNCGKTMDEAGPLWIGPLFNGKFLQKVKDEVADSEFQSKSRAVKLIEAMEEEAEHPELITFYDIHEFCKTHNLIAPKTEKLIEKLRKGKFKVAKTHFTNLGIRTNAGPKKLKEAIKAL